MPPLLVIAAYNRPNTLSRLLQSIRRATIPAGTELRISIDAGGADSVVALAREFPWEHGRKTVQVADEHLGLKAHVLRCGDLAREHGRVVVLEDDLCVAPQFFPYATEALDYYEADDAVAGVSLYANVYNETANLPFCPYDDGSDVFFAQIASSWGQAWTARQWEHFRAWQDEAPSGRRAIHLPAKVQAWPQTSWKKEFIAYLIDTDRFVVYPRRSFSTPCGDRGTHHKNRPAWLTAPLCQGPSASRFCAVNDSLCLYDAWSEVRPDCLKAMAPWVAEYTPLVVDLYGTKGSPAGVDAWTLTSRATRNSRRTFGLVLKPHELNLVHECAGDDIHLARTSDCLERIAHPRAFFQHHASTIVLPRAVVSSLRHRAIHGALLTRSLSWRITAPLRAMAKPFERFAARKRARRKKTGDG